MNTTREAKKPMGPGDKDMMADWKVKLEVYMDYHCKVEEGTGHIIKI